MKFLTNTVTPRPTSSSISPANAYLSPTTLRIHTVADRLFVEFANSLMSLKGDDAAAALNLIPLTRRDKWDENVKILFDLFQRIIQGKLAATQSDKSLPEKAEEYYFIALDRETEVFLLRNEILRQDPAFFQRASISDRYRDMTPDDFQAEFYNSPDRDLLREVGLKKIEQYKERALKEGKILPRQLPKVREILYKMFACDDLELQESALQNLTELIERDPLLISGADKLIQLHDDILGLLESEKCRFLHPTILSRLIKLYALTLELILLYHGPQCALIVHEKTKDRAWDMAQLLKKLNTAKDPELQFWGDYAYECAKNLKTLTTEAEEWLKRLVLLLKATGTTVTAITTHNTVASIADCIEDFKKVFHHLERKKEWFLPVLTTRKLCHFALHETAIFPKIIPMIQNFKQSKSPHILQGMIGILESMALLTDKEEIIKGVLKLLIQYGRLPDPAVSLRIVKACICIYNNKTNPKLSTTAYILLHLFHAARMIEGGEANDLVQATFAEWKQQASEKEKPDFYEPVVVSFLKNYADKKIGVHECKEPLVTALIPSVHPEVEAILACLGNELKFLQAAAPDPDGYTAYHIAAREGYFHLVKQIKSSLKIDINYQDNLLRNTALHIAVLQKNVKTAKALIECGANPNIKNKEGNTPLHLALMENNLELIEILTEGKSDPRALNQLRKTPIDLAIELDNPAILDLLIGNRPSDLFTIIIKAAKLKKFACLKALLQRNTEIPPYVALQIYKMMTSENNDKAMIEFIGFHLEQRKKESYSKGFEPFDHLPQPKIINNAITLVTERKVDSDLLTHLLIFVKEGKSDLKNSAIDPYIAKKDPRGLDYAAAVPELSPLIPKLIEAGFDLRQIDHFSLSPIHIAVIHNNVKGAKELLNKGANVNTPTPQRKFTPLHIAVYLQNEEMVDLLLENGANLKAKTIFGDTPLHILMLKDELFDDRIPVYPLIHESLKESVKRQEGKEAILLEKLFKKLKPETLVRNNSMRPNALSSIPEEDAEQVDYFGNNLLHLAIIYNQITLIPIILRQYPSLFWKKNEMQQMPIECAIGHPNKRALFEELINEEFRNAGIRNQKLSDLSTKFFINMKGAAPLIHILAAAQLSDKAKELIAENGDIAKERDPFNRQQTALHIAAKNGFCDFIAIYKKLGKEYLLLKDRFSNTAGHIAVIYGQDAFAKAWVEATENLTEKNNDGKTLVHLAAFNGNVPLLNFFSERKASFKEPDAHLDLPLHLAALQGYIGAVKFLYEKYKEGINWQNEDGMTPMHYVCLCPSDQEKRIHQSFLYENPQYRLSTTPVVSLSDETLAISLPKEPLEILNYLLTETDAPEIQDITGMTPLMMASASGRDDLVTALLQNKRGADIRKKDLEYRTALHHATLEGQTKVVRLLLKHDATLARPDRKALAISLDINFERPLHTIAKKRIGYKEHDDPQELIAMTDLFIAYGANLGLQDGNEKTALHLAAENGLLQLVTHYMGLATNPDYADQKKWLFAPDRQGKTPLHYAVSNNFPDIVEVLLGGRMDPDSKDKEGFTPLLYTAKSSSPAIAKLLIDSGADVDARDPNENTLVHLILQKDALEESDKELLTMALTRNSALSISCNSQRAGKMRPIHIAAAKGHVEMIDFLSEYMGAIKEELVDHLWDPDGQGRTAGAIAEAEDQKAFAYAWRTMKKSDLKVKVQKDRFGLKQKWKKVTKRFSKKVDVNQNLNLSN